MRRKLIDIDGLRERGINASRWTLLRLEKQGLFPKRVHPTPGKVTWWSDEIDAHLASASAKRGATRCGELTERAL
jgi:predicted DNA-binding transcriptional regulator AlpA